MDAIEHIAAGARVLVIGGRCAKGSRVHYQPIGKGYVVCSPEPLCEAADEARFIGFMRGTFFTGGASVELPSVVLLTGDTNHSLEQWRAIVARIDPSLVEVITELPAPALN